MAGVCLYPTAEWHRGMKYSTRLSDAVHIVVFIALNEEPGLTSARIAESVRTNPAVVRKYMSALKRDGILSNVRGHPEPALARAPEEITLLDVYRSVEGDKPLLHLDTHINPECGMGVFIQESLGDFYEAVQSEAERKMSEISVRDIMDNYQRLLSQSGA